MYAKRSDVSIVGVYVNSTTPIHCICKVCGHEWNSLPNGLLRNHSCPKCAMVKFVSSRRMSHEQYISRMSEVNKDIEIVGQYKNMTTKLLVKCNICGYKWMANPQPLLNGCGCPECAKIRVASKRRKSTDQFLDEIKALDIDITVLEDYTNSNTPILCKCDKCGHKWMPTPSNLLSGHGCPACAGQVLTNEVFLDRMHDAHPNIKVLDEYINSNTRIRVECLDSNCGYTWESLPYDLVHGKGCPECFRRMFAKLRSKSHEEFVKEVTQSNSGVQVTGRYVNLKTKVETICVKCGRVWMANPSTLLKGHACPYCVESSGEVAVANALDSLNIKYERQKVFKDCCYKKPLRFDFYLPDFQTCIEYDGRQHFEPVTFGSCDEEQALKEYYATQSRDKVKDLYCKNNNMALLRIPYWEYNQIDDLIRQKILNS